MSIVRLRIRLQDEQGVALAMAMMIMAVLTVSVVGIIGYATSNAGTSDRARVDEATLYAAESGIDLALSRLGQAADPRVTTLLPSTTTMVGTSSVTYSGTYNAGTNRWTVTSTATTPSPSGGTTPLSRTVIQDLQITESPATVAGNPAWGFLYADSPSGCTMLTNSVQIRQPLYVKNNLCLRNSMKILAKAGTVQVAGPDGINVDSAAEIGSSSESLPTLKVARPGCSYPAGSTTFSWPCNAAQHVYATTQSATVDPVSKPPIDLAARYADASPGPGDFCDNASPGLAANFFDTNTTMDKSAGDRSLFPGTNYTCTTASGTLSWVTGSPGTLTINGTIFIDGNINMPLSTKAVVSGRGTIYVSGTIILKGSMKFCGKWFSGDCDWTTWDPEVSLLVLVAGDLSPTTTESILLDQSLHFQGALWGENMVKVTSSVQAQGPMIGDTLTYGSSSGSIMIPFVTLPPGTPKQGGWSVTPAVGTWREG